MDRLSQAKLFESEKKQADSMLLQAANIFDEYTSTRDRLQAKQKADPASHPDINAQLNERYLSILKEAIDGMCDRMNSSREEQDVGVDEITSSIEHLLNTNHGHIHDKEHLSPDSEEVSCRKNITRPASTLVTSIKERINRINSMLYDLNIMASDAVNGNQDISLEQIKALLQQLLNHRCQLPALNEADCDDQQTSTADILSLMNQLRQQEEPYGKYEGERKEASLKFLTKLSKARSVVEQ